MNLKPLSRLFLAVMVTFSYSACGQDVVDWDGSYQIQLSDFRSAGTRIGSVDIFSLNPACNFDFSFYMTNAEFMLTKNFNSRVNCSFRRNLATLVAPDTATAMSLVDFSRYEFDLSELYARKFRKKLFEEKGAFSNIKFMEPIYIQVQNDLAERHTLAASESDLGMKKEKLAELHEQVRREIEELNDYCKTCKPRKKKSK